MQNTDRNLAEFFPPDESLGPLDHLMIVDAVSRGSLQAFRELFDCTAGLLRLELAELPEDRAAEVLAATYVEVWWLAGCYRRPGLDVLKWITAIARRRTEESSRAAERGTLRPTYPELELATLLRRPVGRPMRTEL